MSKLQAKNDANQYRRDQEKEAAKEVAKKIEQTILTIQVKAGENGKIFGGVSSKEIAENLEEQYGIKVDKKKINLKETIKTLGTQTIEIKLFEGVIGKLRVSVIEEK